MTAKQLPFREAAREKILRGVNVLAEAVKETPGPRARTALLRARTRLTGPQGANHDEDCGVRILLHALEEPLRQPVRNAGLDASVVLNRVVAGGGNFGFNAASGEYGDMVAMGILDPWKVTRSALQNAASIAELLLATGCMVARLSQSQAVPPMMPEQM